MNTEREILNAVDKLTQPAKAPEFCDVAARAITYKVSHLTENPPKRRSVKRRLLGLAVAAALTVSVFGGMRGVEYLQAKGSPYWKVYNAMKSYRAADEQWSLGGFFTGAKNAMGDKSAAAPGAQTAESDTAGRDDHSTTNTQVSGVDEGDILKSDGKYLYILSKTGTVRIADAEKMELQSVLPPYDAKFSPSELYIDGDFLVVAGTYGIGYGDVVAYDGADDSRAFYGAPDAYSRTGVAVYDISDRKKPKKTGEFFQDGSLLSSRMIGGYVYLLSNYGVSGVSEIKPSNIEEYIPKIGPAGAEKLVSPGCIDILKTNPTGYTVVSSVQIADPAKNSTRSVLGSGSVVYASQTAVYILAADYSAGEASTDVIRFDVKDGRVEKSASGKVPGTVVNQFAADEREGYLRVATSAQNNSIYVLDAALKIRGKVMNLAPGEQIKSVRYIGKMGYVVTFRQTDPLFAVDLGDPAAPKLLGELKIPGFSTYMHPYDDKTLIGVGFDADSATGGTRGLKISIFDVSDPADMKETQSYVFGQGGYFESEATYDHKAVLFSRERSLLVIPARYAQTSAGDSYYGQSGASADEFNGAMVFEVTDKGVKLRATLTHRQDTNASFASAEYYAVRRSAYIGQKLYTVSEGMLMCVSLSDYKLLGTLTLTSAEDAGAVQVGPNGYEKPGVSQGGASPGQTEPAPPDSAAE